MTDLTEKELAEKVTAVYHEGSDLEAIMRNIARRAAELLGVTLAPEKPEPGTWHIVKDGPQVGDAARVDENGYLHVIGGNGKTLRDIHPDNTWPALTPARVVPAEPVELSEEEVGEIYEAESMSYHWDNLPTSSSGMRPNDMQKDITLTVNAALAKHGHGRVEVAREQVERAVDEACKGLFVRQAWADDLTDAIYESLLGGGDRG